MSILVSGTFDIECQEWDKFVMGGAYDGNTYFSTRNIGELLDYMLERGGTWWGHYSGAYDMLAILAEHSARGGNKVKCFMAGSRITCASFGRKLQLRDSFAIAPTSLEKFAQLSGVAKTTPDLPCICGETCGGYCSIRRDMSAIHYHKVNGYMENDCRVLHSSLVYWLDFLRDNFGEPKGTIGASAFSFTHQKKATWETTALYGFAQKGYYGGRTEVWKRESLFGYHDDINSAYVDALRLPMPVGPTKECYYTIPPTAKYWIAEAVVNVPESHIPPLPIRRDGRLYYPHGQFFGTWNKTELEAACQDGVSIIKLGRIIYWEAMDTPYIPFCEHVWGIRDGAGKNTVAGKLIKQLSVSVCGKLAQRPDVKEVVYSPEPLMGWKSLDKGLKWWYKEHFKVADCAHVHHAGVMTAHVRVRVRRRGNQCGAGAVYCDTDGVFGERFIADGLGKELGEWLPSGAEKGHDGTYRNGYFHAPKLYEYEELEPEFRAKGFSLGRKNPRLPDPMQPVRERFNKIVRGEEIEITRGVYPLLKSLRQRNTVFERREEHKKFHINERWCGGRLKEGKIETRPPHIDEINNKIRTAET